MNLEQLLKLDNEIITLEEMEEIEGSELVESVEFNGMSGINNCKWYSIYLNETYIKEDCDDSNQIQVYIK